MASDSAGADEKRMTLQMAGRERVDGGLDWVLKAALGTGLWVFFWQDSMIVPGLIETNLPRDPVATGRSPEVDVPWEVVASSELIVVSHKRLRCSPERRRGPMHLGGEGLG